MLRFRHETTGVGVLLAAAGLQAAKSLEVYFIDVEGGQSTLLVTPNGESLLVDAGYPGNNQRDANRIAAAAKLAGVKKIDYLVISHYHEDHVGGVQQLTWKMPVLNYVDHGPNSETGKAADIRFNEYSSFRDKGHHILAKPGETLPIKGMEVRLISSNGDVIGAPLAGAGSRIRPARDSRSRRRTRPRTGARWDPGYFRGVSILGPGGPERKP